MIGVSLKGIAPFQYSMAKYRQSDVFNQGRCRLYNKCYKLLIFLVNWRKFVILYNEPFWRDSIIRRWYKEVY